MQMFGYVKFQDKANKWMTKKIVSVALQLFNISYLIRIFRSSRGAFAAMNTSPVHTD